MSVMPSHENSRENVVLTYIAKPVDPSATGIGFIYKMPPAKNGENDGGVSAQNFSLLGREDLGAASGSNEYREALCEKVPNEPEGLDEIVDSIGKRASNERIVIVNESHAVTQHRDFMRRVIRKLRPLGFNTLAVEALTNTTAGLSPILQHANLAWPHQNDGYYTNEPIFGRLIRDAKALGYRIYSYEQPEDATTGTASGDNGIAGRERVQANNIANILKRMGSRDRLLIYVGYAHAKETTQKSASGQSQEWMAARLKKITGIDPLTIAQTICRSKGGASFLAKPPFDVLPNTFDLIVSHPVETFLNRRPLWRIAAGDIPIDIPPALRPTVEPLVLEAFNEGEPLDAVPVDRVLVRPGETIPLLLPPGRYLVRAVRLLSDDEQK